MSAVDAMDWDAGAGPSSVAPVAQAAVAGTRPDPKKKAHLPWYGQLVLQFFAQ